MHKIMLEKLEKIMGHHRSGGSDEVAFEIQALLVEVLIHILAELEKSHA